eukprot:scaffold698_cov127-Isochrysis_galbana.AAC.5
MHPYPPVRARVCASERNSPISLNRSSHDGRTVLGPSATATHLLAPSRAPLLAAPGLPPLARLHLACPPPRTRSNATASRTAPLASMSLAAATTASPSTAASAGDAPTAPGASVRSGYVMVKRIAPMGRMRKGV